MKRFQVEIRKGKKVLANYKITANSKAEASERAASAFGFLWDYDVNAVFDRYEVVVEEIKGRK